MQDKTAEKRSFDKFTESDSWDPFTDYTDKKIVSLFQKHLFYLHESQKGVGTYLRAN